MRPASAGGGVAGVFVAARQLEADVGAALVERVRGVERGQRLGLLAQLALRLRQLEARLDVAILGHAGGHRGLQRGLGLGGVGRQVGDAERQRHAGVGAGALVERHQRRGGLGAQIGRAGHVLGGLGLGGHALVHVADRDRRLEVERRAELDRLLVAAQRVEVAPGLGLEPAAAQHEQADLVVRSVERGRQRQQGGEPCAGGLEERPRELRPVLRGLRLQRALHVDVGVHQVGQRVAGRRRERWRQRVGGGVELALAQVDLGQADDRGDEARLQRRRLAEAFARGVEPAAAGGVLGGQLVGQGQRARIGGGLDVGQRQQRESAGSPGGPDRPAPPPAAGRPAR
jgi:hypothetical protein